MGSNQFTHISYIFFVIPIIYKKDHADIPWGKWIPWWRKL